MEYRQPLVPHVPLDGMALYAEDMTVTAGAGVLLDALQRQLADHGQWLPIDGDPSCPVGELVAFNSTGPLRLGFGAWRDLLLGCQFMNHRGELITAGGRAFKNVAGYDLTKLLVGQQGKLGRIVTVTVRTYKQPRCAARATFNVDLGVINRLLPSPCKPHWMILDASGLYGGYLGDERFIELIAQSIGAFSPVNFESISVAEEIVGRTALWESRATDGAMPFRASVPPSRVLQFVKQAMLENWVADPVFGIVKGICTEESFLRINEIAMKAGGRAWCISSSGNAHEADRHPVLKRLIDAFASAQ